MLGERKGTEEEAGLSFREKGKGTALPTPEEICAKNELPIAITANTGKKHLSEKEREIPR